MKRSEAILLIWNELVEPHFPDDGEKTADYILKKLEKRGMLPPSYMIFPNNKGIGGAVAATRIDGKWESE